MNSNNKSISEDVLQKIKHGDVRMKPRTYFVLLSATAVISTLLAGLTIAYFTSIVVFWVKIQTADTMAYGARRNLSEAISSFPWWAMILALLLLVLAVWLVRKHGTMYRHKPLTIAFTIVLLSILTGLIFAGFGIGDLQHTRQMNTSNSPHSRKLQQQ